MQGMWMRRLGFLGVFLLALALGQRITPQGIIVNPTPGDLQVRVWVDRDPTGRGQAVYQIGDPILIYVSVNRDAYVYLFSINAEGRIDPILPNPFERNNFLRAGETRRFPPEGASYRYTVTGPEGEDLVLALASLRPLNLREILDIERGQVRVQGVEALSRALSIVVEPLPPKDWVTAVARFTVVRAGLPPAPPALATLVLDSRPQGAEVRVDGRLVGRTPLELQVTPGRKEVEFRLAGYQTYRTAVNPRPGERVQVLAQLVPEARTGTLSVDSNPRGAEVHLNGQPRGRTPLTLTLNEGSYRLEVRLSGYQPYQATVRVERGRETRLTANLVPEVRTGTLNLDSNPRGAEVYVNGEPRGRTPLTLVLNEGSYRVEFRLPGYQPYQTMVRVERGREVRVLANLVPEVRKGVLNLDSTPRGALVELDGRPQGQTPLSLEVLPGTYLLRLSLPGYQTFETPVEVRPGEVQYLTVALTPLPLRAVLELRLNVEARVFLDGEEVGLARGGYLRLELPLGRYELTLVAPGFRTRVQEVELLRDEALRFNLEPLRR